MKTLKQLIKDGNFDYVDSGITEENFPAPKDIRTDFKLYHFNRDIQSEDAIKEMKKDGYKPASIYELLSWKKWNREDFVVALGSVVGVGVHRYVTCLYGSGSRRGLDLRWFVGGWSVDCCFLAVRNGSKTLDTKDSELCTSDILTLDDHIRAVKEAGYVVSKIM